MVEKEKVADPTSDGAMALALRDIEMVDLDAKPVCLKFLTMPRSDAGCTISDDDYQFS